jgi:lipoate-protein ligase A
MKSFSAMPPMMFNDYTSTEPAANLAFDEALLDMAEEGAIGETLRVWEPRSIFVVVGYGNHVDREVNRAFCDGRGISIYRRCSGGGTVLQAPGVLNYSLILCTSSESAFGSIAGANRAVMERNRKAVVNALGQNVERDGCTDLVWKGRKFSGNAQRRKKNFLLFHGTFLLNADIGLIEMALAMPSKQPKYRQQRSHTDFLVNLPAKAAELKGCLCAEWDATIPAPTIPDEPIAKLTIERYATTAWNYKF